MKPYRHDSGFSITFKKRQDVEEEKFLKKHYGDLPEWAIALHGYRSRDGITQKALEKAIGIHQTNISKRSKRRDLLEKL